jgi:hypothetical protein
MEGERFLVAIWCILTFVMIFMYTIGPPPSGPKS